MADRRQYFKEYFQKNKTRIRQYWKEYWINIGKNKCVCQKCLEKKKEIEKQKQQNKQWRENNRKKYNLIHRLSEQKRRYKLRNGGTFTTKQWYDLIEKYGYRCAICGKRFSRYQLTIDHIIPISKNGLNIIDNIQPLCPICNSKKGNKLDVSQNICV
jgi:5-methylcytosine-specific restriction endonuclease McrA